MFSIFCYFTLRIAYTYYLMDASNEFSFFRNLIPNKIKGKIVECIHCMLYQTTIHQRKIHNIKNEVVRRAFCRQCSHKLYDTFRVWKWQRNWRNDRPDAIYTIVSRTWDGRTKHIGKQQYNVQSIELNSSTWTVISMQIQRNISFCRLPK